MFAQVTDKESDWRLAATSKNDRREAVDLE